MKAIRTLAFVAGIVAVLLPVAEVSAQGTLFVEGDFVGVGIQTPTRPLHVVTTGAPQNTVIELENNGPTRFRFRNSSTGETWNVGHQSPSGTGLVFSDVGDPVSEMLLDVSGNMTIAGTLTTAGGNYPDYVFEDSYQLMPLAELAWYIEEQGHLPRVPSAGDVEENGGVNVSELQLLLLEKVEELTLYTLAQQEQLEAQQKVIDELRTRLTAADSGATALP